MVFKTQWCALHSLFVWKFPVSKAISVCELTSKYTVGVICFAVTCWSWGPKVSGESLSSKGSFLLLSCEMCFMSQDDFCKEWWLKKKRKAFKINLWKVWQKHGLGWGKEETVKQMDEGIIHLCTSGFWHLYIESKNGSETDWLVMAVVSDVVV